MLTLKDINYRAGGRPLLEGASAQIPDGHRVGLVGRNGSGKTTLLRLILGEAAPESGDVLIGARRRVGAVAQETPDGDATPLDTVIAADREMAALMAEAERAEDANRLGEVHARLEDLGAHRAESRASRILDGLGFDEAARRRPLKEFSGGWKMRVALAGALFQEPDILLLDEPTNHLDLEAALWLEGYLSNYPRTLILVSHDRGLLNRVPKHILHLEDMRLTLYTGNYDRFERTRAEAQERQAALFTRQQAQRRHIQQFVDRFRYKASKARQAQSRLKMLERMEPIASVAEGSTVSFQLPKPDILPPPIVTLDKAAIGYELDKPILSRLNLRIDMDDRIALLGANGNGKTTFLRLLAEQIVPQEGAFRRSSKLEVGYFAQNQMEDLNPVFSAVEHLQSLDPMAVETKLRSHLGRFGFPQDKADTKIANLSGGEKARLALAVICRRQPHLLLLDEPTNHLDIDSRQALIQALADYEGAVILVSHDPHLVTATADRLWLVKDGTVSVFDGDMDDYRALLEEERKAARRDARGGAAVKPAEKPVAKTVDRKDRAEARAKLAPLRKQVSELEAKLDRLTTDRDTIREKLGDPATYSNTGTDVEALTKLAADLDTAIEAVETAWLTAQERLEEAG